MSKNASIGIVVALAAAAILGGYFYFSGQEKPAAPMEKQAEEQQPAPETGAAAQGRAVFSITDASAQMENISEVVLTVNKLEAYSATQGWVTVSEGAKKYNLLALKAEGDLQVLADVTLDAGRYTEVRMRVSDVTVVEKSGARKTARLPSEELKFVSAFTIEANRTVAVTFDFLANQSLHTAERGEYVFAPVIKVESRINASIAVQSSGEVTVNGGRLETSTTVGMDLDGTMKAGFMLDAKSMLEYSGGVIRLKL